MAIDLERAAAEARHAMLTEARCREIIGGILERTTNQKLRVDSLRTVSGKWIHGKELSKSKGTSTRYSATIDRFLEFLPTKADLPITAITPQDCQAFYDYLAGLKLAPATLVVEIKTLRNLFNYSRRLGLITLNPAEAVQLPENIRQVKRRTITPAQIGLLLKEADLEWQTAILFGFYGGLRLGDAMRRQWTEVDFERQRLKFIAGKTGDELEIPLHPVLERHLAKLAGDNLGPICPKLNAVPVGGYSGLSKKFQAIMRKAGIGADSVETGGQRKLATVSFHSLRKSFNSMLHNQGVSQELRKRLTGHKSDAVNDRYTSTELATLRAAVGKLPDISK